MRRFMLLTMCIVASSANAQLRAIPDPFAGRGGEAQDGA
jgi:hypothetical protein